MIRLVTPLAVGNALRLFLEPPVGATAWRVLRKETDTFTGENDAEAFLVAEGTMRSLVDFKLLENGRTYFYRAYYRDGAAWTASPSVSAVPASTYVDHSSDALSVLRDRLDFGLAEEVKRGTIRHKLGSVPVLTAPPVFDETRWPVVTVQLMSESPNVRSLGEQVVPDLYDAFSQGWKEYEGWLAKVQIAVMAWSLNPDERIALRKALRRIIVGNLPVFDEEGMTEIDFTVQDMEDFETFSAPVYQVMGTFSCLAPVAVSDAVSEVADVQTSLSTG